MFKRATASYGKTPEAETPYQKAGQVWDERIGSARVQAKNWRLMAFGCLALATAASAGLIWRSLQSTVTPYVVEVNEVGDVRVVQSAIENYQPSDAQIAHHLARFLQNVRALSIDPIVVRHNWLAAYAFATDRGANTLNEYARQNDPFSDVGKKTRTVEVTSVVRSSPRSFEVRWIERTFENGSLAATERFTGVLTVILKSPRDAETLRNNPLGVYVHGLNWTRDLISGDTK
jgi:type IV secretion system protein VirB5